MLSIEKCKRILNKNGYNYTDDKVEKIRDFLYFIAEIEYEDYSNSKKKGGAKIESKETQNDSEKP